MFGAAQKGNEARGGIKDETSLGLQLVVPSTETGNTEEAEALAERKGKQCQRHVHTREETTRAPGRMGSELGSVM